MTEKEKKDRARREFLLRVIMARLIRSINSGNAFKFKGKLKGKRPMKITTDLLKFTSQFKNMKLTKQQFEFILRMAKADIQNHTPQDTGFLKALISYKVTGDNKGELFIKEKKYPDKTGTKYGVTSNQVAKFQHFGTESHKVKAREKDGYLHFFFKGRWIKKKEVEVSGVVATEFFKISPKGLTSIRKMMETYYKQNLGIK